MVSARLAVATLCVVTACGNSAATPSTPAGPSSGAVAPYRVALARCLDVASFDLPDRVVDDVAVLDAANQACDQAAAELDTADLAGSIRTAADTLQREFASLDAAFDRTKQLVDRGDFDETAQSELLVAISKFQSAASQML